VTDERDPGALDEPSQGIGRVGSLGRDDAAVGSGDREGQRGAAPRPMIGWPAIQGASSSMRSAPRTSIRIGSEMAAAKALGRSSAVAPAPRP